MKLHNRQIKASFWTDPDLLQWPRDKRWFYEGLIQLADDSGCLEDSPFAFKLHLFPSPVDADITVERITEWVNELVEQRKLVRYVAEGKQCLYLTNFHKHQSLRSPAEPEVPLPPWIKYTPSPKSRRSGTYVVNAPTDILAVSVDNPYGDRTVTVRMTQGDPTVTVEQPYGDQLEREREVEREQEIDHQQQHHHCARAREEQPNFCLMFEQEFGRPLSPLEVEQIADMEENHDSELIREAVRRSVAQGKRNLRYIQVILENWRGANLHTLHEVLAYEEERAHARTRDRPAAAAAAVKTKTPRAFAEIDAWVRGG